INDLIGRTERLAAVLTTQALEYVVCHADIHWNNLLIDAKDVLHVVDWDTLILAPKERDLMFVRGGQYGDQATPEQEESLFFRGYGAADLNPAALAYYRYERIIEDIAAYTEQILLTDSQRGGQDRIDGLRRLSGQFEPGAVIDLSYQAEKRFPPANPA